MDRSSRIQNPAPLSGGGFSKPISIQSGVVVVKPLPPLLHDRFRAMLKEREEEIRVFGGDEIVRLYEIVLSELTMNSKPIITDLTIIAGEQRAHSEGIAGAICSRILEVPADQKLPSLYLLDSIVKNIGKDYIKFFSAHLPEVFCEAYAALPSMHSAMRHLFKTWSTVFPLVVLQKIETRLQFSASSVASQSPRPTNGIHINPKYVEAKRQFGHSTVDPSPSLPATDYGPSKAIAIEEETSEWRKRKWQENPKTQLQPSSLYKRSTGIDLQRPRALISAYGMDEREKHLNHKHHKAEGAWQNTEEEEFDWQDMNTSSADRGQILPSHSTLPPHMQSMGQFGMKNASVYLPPISNIRPGMVPFHTAAQPSLVPPLKYGYLPQGQGAYANPFNGPLPGTNRVSPIAQNIGQVDAKGLITSLMAKGLISLNNQDPIRVGVDFDQETLKVRRESVLTSLYADLPRQCKTCGIRFRNQDDHSKHMDWHVTKNRTLKARKAKPSPKWFVSVEMWLSSAEASGSEAVPGFSLAEKAEEEEEDGEAAVPADDSQPACALCGERFDDFYSDEMEEWMYRGAVYMHAPGGLTAGMENSQFGPIVHVKCRSDSNGTAPDKKAGL